MFVLAKVDIPAWVVRNIYYLASNFVLKTVNAMVSASWDDVTVAGSVAFLW